MQNTPKEIERDELYKKVWSEPITKLAPKYGISDVALKKICKKLNVPTPPRGHWTRIQYNIHVQIAPLPLLIDGQPSTYEIQKADEPDNTPTLTEEAMLLIRRFRTGEPVNVPKRLTSPHPLVQKTRDILSKEKPDKYGILRGWRGKQIDIRVSQNQLRRALRIMNALVRFFERHGYELTYKENKDYVETQFVIFNERVPFYIQEPSRRQDHIPTVKEKAEELRYSWRSYDLYDYQPSGKLILQINPWTGTASNIKKRWRDGVKKRIEDSLMDFAVNVVAIADLMRIDKIERQEKQQRWEEERNRQAELARLRERETKKLRDLENQADRWWKSKQLRLYIEAVGKEALDRGLNADIGALSIWLSWAKEQANRIDPLNNELPFEFEKKDV